MTKAPSTAARVTVALCSRAMAAVDGERANDGVAARIRRTCKDWSEEIKIKIPVVAYVSHLIV